MIALSTAIHKHRAAAGIGLVAAWSLGMLGLAGCHPATAPEPAKDSGATEAAEGITLTAEQVAKLGVVSEPAISGEYQPEIAGYGVIVAHEIVATAVAELTTAQAATAQSRAVAARAQRLAGTPGAMSAEATESAARQVATDDAALALAERRLSSLIGEGAGDGTSNRAVALQDLASGKVKLLRATFALGTLPGPPPARLRAARLDAAAPGEPRSPRGWVLQPVWNAPADATVPGRSFFALLSGSDAGEGERLLVWAPGSGPARKGVTVPAAALVISGGRYWCYVERKARNYVRREVATDMPVGNGYLVTEGIAAGEKIVTSAAGLLLAREMNPSTEAD